MTPYPKYITKQNQAIYKVKSVKCCNGDNTKKLRSFVFIFVPSKEHLWVFFYIHTSISISIFNGNNSYDRDNDNNNNNFRFKTKNHQIPKNLIFTNTSKPSSSQNFWSIPGCLYFFKFLIKLGYQAEHT